MQSGLIWVFLFEKYTLEIPYEDPELPMAYCMRTVKNQHKIQLGFLPSKQVFRRSVKAP